MSPTPKCRKCAGGRTARVRRHHRRCPLRGIGTWRSTRRLLDQAFVEYCAVRWAAERFRSDERPVHVADLRRREASPSAAGETTPLREVLRHLPHERHVSGHYDALHEAALLKEVVRLSAAWPVDLLWLLRHRFRGSVADLYFTVERLGVLWGSPQRVPATQPSWLIYRHPEKWPDEAALQSGELAVRLSPVPPNDGYWPIRIPVPVRPIWIPIPKRPSRRSPQIDFAAHAPGMLTMEYVDYHPKDFASDTLWLKVYVPDAAEHELEKLVQDATELCRYADVLRLLDQHPWLQAVTDERAVVRRARNHVQPFDEAVAEQAKTTCPPDWLIERRFLHCDVERLERAAAADRMRRATSLLRDVARAIQDTETRDQRG